MKRGAWHQFGDRSQKLSREQLQHGRGKGVVLSIRDLSLDNASAYAADYLALESDLIVDHQFYLPRFSNRHIETYPIRQFRKSISDLARLTVAELDQLSNCLDATNRAVGATAILAPAVVYEQEGKTM